MENQAQQNSENQSSQQDTNQENSGQSTNNLPSAKILLEIIQKEYEYEVDRNRNFETKAGMFLAFVGALLVFIPSYLDINAVFRLPVNNVLQAVPYSSVIILLIITVISLIIASVYFVKLLTARTYSRLSLIGFNKDNAECEEEKVCYAAMEQYVKIVEINSKANDKKADLYKKGIYFVLSSLIFSAICFVISLFIIG